MHRMLFFILAIAALSLTGCTGVFVGRPVGEKPHKLTSEAWEGLWFSGADTCRARIVDADGGKLQVLSIKSKNGKVEVETTDLLVREAGDWLIINLRDNESPSPRYEWARAKLNGEQLVAWLPDKNKFHALIRDGKVKGHVQDRDIVLEPFSAEDLKALTSGAWGVPFTWDEPLVYRRIAR